MYIIKNALRNIFRYKGRNVLICIIVLVISVSACIALSIKESAVKVKEDTLNSNTITAQISLNRDKIMNKAKSEENSKDTMKNALMENNSLSLEDLLKYSKAKSVKSFYYTATASLNAGSKIEPVDVMGTFTRENDTNSSNSNNNLQTPPDNIDNKMSDKGQPFGKMGSQGDFTVIGHSSDEAMTDFISGNSYITEGSMFKEGTEKYNCIINEELATYNSLKINDKIVLVNPNDESEKVKLNVVGIYSTKTNNITGTEGFSTATDSANQILMSYNALNKITVASEKSSNEITDDTTGITTTSSIKEQLSGTYVFANKQDYDNFSNQAAEMGLSEEYSITSQDVDSVELSLQPLENLSKMATYFLWVVLIIGTVILVVFNIFNIRERKYEIGVLTAIGMKKSKVALQFVTELFVFTIVTVIIGTGIGAASSVPVTNSLLKSQIESNYSVNQQMNENFNRETNAEKRNIEFGTNQQPPNNNTEKDGGFMNDFKKSTVNYIESVSYSTNLSVVVKLMGIGVLLTLISSLSAVLFVMRYKPLRILSNRE